MSVIVHTRLILTSVGLFSLALLADISPGTGDQKAWEVLVDICRPSAVSSPNETSVAWRLWSTQSEVYPGPNETVPQSTGIFDKFRRLSCRSQAQQQQLFAGFRRLTLDGQQECEIVFLNQPAASYIISNKLYRRRQLITAAMSKGGLQLPQGLGNVAREIKTEWRQIESSNFGRYIVALNDSPTPQAYGLVAIHLMTHEQPNWLWATWIHEDYTQYMPEGFALSDKFGTQADGISKALGDLLSQSNEQFLSHYKLIGSQVDFTPRTLGNPLIEGKDLGTFSCMGCHRYASLASDGTWPIPDPSNLIGTVLLPPGRFATDFDYSLVSQSKCKGVSHCNNAIPMDPQ